MKVSVFRGNEFDVLDRYYQAVKKFKADLIVHITSDCPLVSPFVVDKVIKRYKNSKCDYALAISEASNPLSYPPGVRVEVFSQRILEEIHRKAKRKEQREHVAIYLKEYPEKYKYRRDQTPKSVPKTYLQAYC